MVSVLMSFLAMDNQPRRLALALILTRKSDWGLRGRKNNIHSRNAQITLTGVCFHMIIDIISRGESSGVTPDISLVFPLVYSYVVELHDGGELHCCEVDSLPVTRDTQIENDRLHEGDISAPVPRLSCGETPCDSVTHHGLFWNPALSNHGPVHAHVRSH